MRLSYDKESGAFTIYSREGKPDHAEDSSNEDFSRKADVCVDVDAEGRVLSIEALSASNKTPPRVSRKHG